MLRLAGGGGERVPARWSLLVDRRGLDPEVEHQVRHHAQRCEEEGPGGIYLRADWRDQRARDGDRERCDGRVRGVREWLDAQGVAVLEGDVKPLRRHLSDTGREVACSMGGLCYLDLETDSRVPFSRKEEMRILSFAVVSHATGEIKSDLLDRDDDAAERHLIEKLQRALEPYDTVACWNGARFDEPVLYARAERAGLVVEWRRWNWIDHLQAYEKYAIAASGEQKVSLGLNDVAQAVVGEGKAGALGAKSWETWRDDPLALLRYNEVDTELMRKIEGKTHYLRLHLAVCRLCRCLPTTRSLRANELVDGYMLRLGVERGHRWPTKPGRLAYAAPFEGAYVMDPEPGAYDDVHATDLSSTYPACILALNCSPETLVREGEQATDPVVIHPTKGTRFRLDIPGLFPAALVDLVARRKVLQREEAAVPAGSPEWEDLHGQSAALKVIVNSFYGVMGSPSSRYYVRECGEAVSTMARWLLEEGVLALARQMGLTTIYSDTDASYLHGCSAAEVTEFVRRFNEERAPEMLRSIGAVQLDVVDLAYEKVLRRLVIVSAKRYAATVASYKGKLAEAGAVEIKGLEWKRADQVRLAREMQREAIDLLLRVGPLPSPEEAAALASRWRRRVADGRLDLEDVSLSQSISREEYAAKTPPPHARVAAILKERGEDVGVGTRIRYWVAGSEVGEKLDPRPASDYDEDLVDRAYYWEHRIWPPTRRLLAAALPGADWARHDRLDGSTGRRRKAAPPIDGQGDLFSRAEDAQPSPSAEDPPTGGFLLSADGLAERDWGATWQAVRAVLEAHPGGEPVVLRVRSEGASTELELTLRASSRARGDLCRVLGRDDVEWPRPA